MIREFDAAAGRIFGGPLRHPVFYSCRYGLRFDLAPRRAGEIDPRVSLDRALALYRRLPGAPDLLRIDLNILPEGARRASRYMRGLCRRAGLPWPGSVTNRIVRIDDEDAPEWVSHCWRIGVGFRPEVLLAEITALEFNRLERLMGCAFFLDTANGVLYHPYSFEGADVVAARPEALLPLYGGLNDWLLDYDRARMDGTFKEMREEQ